MGDFSANLKYDFVTGEKAEEALKTASSENIVCSNYSINFSTEGQYLLVSISATSSALLQDGLNAVYPIIEKLFSK